MNNSSLEKEEIKYYIISKEEEYLIKYGFRLDEVEEQAIVEYFQLENVPLELKKEMVDKYFEKILENFKQVKNVLEEVKEEQKDTLIEENSKAQTNDQNKNKTNKVVNRINKLVDNQSLYWVGGVVQNLITGDESSEIENNISCVCNIKNINHIRKVFKENNIYVPELDSINYVDSIYDYGFETEIDGVKVSICPFEQKANRIEQYSFDSKEKICRKGNIEVERLEDYVTNVEDKQNEKNNCVNQKYSNVALKELPVVQHVYELNIKKEDSKESTKKDPVLVKTIYNKPPFEGGFVSISSTIVGILATIAVGLLISIIKLF